MTGFYVVDPELYHRYKDQVLELSNSYQVDINEHLPEGDRRRGLSDQEIAERLGLDVRDVTEIRVVGERDSYPLEEFQKAAEFKEKAARTYSKSGVSHVFKPDYEV